FSSCDVRCSSDAGQCKAPSHGQPYSVDQSDEGGGSASTSCVGLERDTAPRELESHSNISRNLRPLSWSGFRGLICVSFATSAPSTAIAKNAACLFSTASRSARALSCHESVGPPSVIMKIHGR